MRVRTYGALDAQVVAVGVDAVDFAEGYLTHDLLAVARAVVGEAQRVGRLFLGVGTLDPINRAVSARKPEPGGFTRHLVLDLSAHHVSGFFLSYAAVLPLQHCT